PRAVSLRYPPPAAPALSALVQVRWHDGARFSRVLPPGEGSVDLPSASEPVEVLRSYAKLGLEHIAGGLDHLLFLLLLVFVVRTPPRALLTVTGFTVAHALTLGLAVAGVVRLPGAAVEPAIAMSIVVLALELARGRRASWTFRHPISVAFAFGLLHGFGFAGALVEAGLPRSELGPALAAFHVGVELGQLALVLLALGLMRVLRRVERPAERVAAYATGIVATFWTFERVATLWGL
ncbi:MAG TPA: HupE/UreJ family protein, partial [Polyangiaceae bacterium LLY-WYZ-15_(1-7)]|nr:HupE/UreJ family protein [Polyangiaceae bacterium LLY-WYZ-15_(1-7)]